MPCMKTCQAGTSFWGDDIGLDDLLVVDHIPLMTIFRQIGEAFPVCILVSFLDMFGDLLSILFEQ